ncbi:MAG: TrbC/VirB2 family protein [Ehrlichia sp.]
MLRFIFVVTFFVVGSLVYSQNAQAQASEDNTVEKVICNVILFVQKLGLPIMTGVILGSSIMAIFGRLPWPAIVMLVVFTAIFFGAGKLLSKFAKGIQQNAESFDCKASA